MHGLLPALQPPRMHPARLQNLAELGRRPAPPRQPGAPVLGLVSWAHAAAEASRPAPAGSR